MKKNCRLTLDQIKEIVKTSFNEGDTIHISKKCRIPIVNAPAIFKDAYNHFIRIEAFINNVTWETYTITYSELFTGDITIHELDDKMADYPLS